MSQKFSALILAAVCFIGFTFPATVEAGLLSSSVRRTMSQRALSQRGASSAALKDVEAKRVLYKRTISQEKSGLVSAQEKEKAIKALDAARDKTLPIKPMDQSRTVSRYTNWKQAKSEQANGIARKSHMTSAEVGPGRPLSAATAKNRFGLAKEPNARMIVTIPKGQPVRKGKVIAGQSGYGEITSTRQIRPEYIQEVRRLN